MLFITRDASLKRHTVHSVEACFLALHEEEWCISAGCLKHKKGLSAPMEACCVRPVHEEHLSQKQGLAPRWRH